MCVEHSNKAALHILCHCGCHHQRRVFAPRLSAVFSFNLEKKEYKNTLIIIIITDSVGLCVFLDTYTIYNV